MLITNPTNESMGSLVRLFELLRDDPRMNVGNGIIAIGRPEPSVAGEQYAHIRVGYDRGRGRTDERTFAVHWATARDGELVLNGGYYDLTAVEAWEIVSGKVHGRDVA